MLDRHRMEEEEQWRALTDEMPYLRFPPDLEVRIIPPFGGAACRFTVRLRRRNPTNTVSVYFDSSSALGCMNQPYWEAYPIKENNNRYLLGEEQKMIRHIARELRSKG